MHVCRTLSFVVFRFFSVFLVVSAVCGIGRLKWFSLSELNHHRGIRAYIKSRERMVNAKNVRIVSFLLFSCWGVVATRLCR